MLSEVVRTRVMATASTVILLLQLAQAGDDFLSSALVAAQVTIKHR